MVPRYSKSQLLAIAQMPGLLMLFAAWAFHWLWLSITGAVLLVTATVLVMKLDKRWSEERPLSLMGPAREAVREVSGESYAVGPKVDLVMVSRGERPVQAIGALREIYLMGLKDAEKFLERSEPWVIKKRIPQAEGQFVKARLESAGATVNLVQRG